MTNEEIRKDEDEKEEKEDKKDEREDKDKAVFNSSLDALTETIKGFDINGLKDEIKSVGTQVSTLDARIKALEEPEPTAKALEEPTDLPLKPKVSADDDIGAKTKVPDTYQSNSQQAGIKESDGENETGDDKQSLSMQEKGSEIKKSGYAFTTETPRPEAAIENIEKSSQGIQLNEVLKAAREVGHEELGAVGRRILKGDFGTPPGEENQW